MPATILCPKCGHSEEFKRVRRGSNTLENLLWAFAIIGAVMCLVEPLPAYYFWTGAALLYTAFRQATAYRVCQKCGARVESRTLTGSCKVIGIFLMAVSAVCGIGLIFVIAVPQVALRLNLDRMTDVLCSFVVIGVLSCVIGVWLFVRSRFLAKNVSKFE